MSVEAPSMIRPVNNPRSRIVHIIDVPICSLPIVNEEIIRCLVNVMVFSINESRAKSAPMKNMKNRPVAPSMLVHMTPPKLLNGMLMLYEMTLTANAKAIMLHNRIPCSLFANLIMGAAKSVSNAYGNRNHRVSL